MISDKINVEIGWIRGEMGEMVEMVEMGENWKKLGENWVKNLSNNQAK